MKSVAHTQKHQAQKTLQLVGVVSIFVLFLFNTIYAQTFRTPGNRKTVVFEPVAFDPGIGDHSGPCQTASGRHQYIIDLHIEYANPGTTPTVTLTDFINSMQTGDIGMLFLHSHSFVGGIGIEFYEDDPEGKGYAAMNSAWDHYVNDLGINQNYIYKGHNESGYDIGITAEGLRHWCTNLDETLVFAKGCNSSGLNDDWNALVALGYDATISGLAGVDDFFKRMDGTDKRGPGNRNRSVGDASNGIAHLVPGGNVDVVLSPVVLNHQPLHRELVQESQVGFVEFDCAMDQTIPANEVVTITGTIGQLTNVHWANNHRIEFTVSNLESFATVNFVVHADKAISEHNGSQLDGNTNPNETDGVGPNGDFYTWTSLTSHFATMDFEDGADGAPIQSRIPGMEFITTAGYDWIYGDKRTGNYNIYPYNEATYWCGGSFFAWLGPNQGQGRINFTGSTATSVSMETSNYSGLYVEAYDKNGNLIDSDFAPGNLNTNTLSQLKISGAQIDHVIVHDAGNFWLIDNLTVIDLLQQTLILLPENLAAILNELHTISPGGVENFLVRVDDIADNLQIILNWLGSEMKIVIYDPDGLMYGEYQSTEPPLEVAISDPKPGEWRFEVTAIDIPEDNYPFAIVAATENEPLADCYIDNVDIGFYPEQPSQGQKVDIFAAIHCDPSSEFIDNVLVRCYLGDPDNGGIQIDKDKYAINLTPGSADTVYFRWDTQGYSNEENIYVKIDHLNELREYNENNNKAFRAITVNIVNGLQVSVTNAGGNPASNAWVRIYPDTTEYQFYEGYTDENGMLTLPYVPEGTYTVLISSHSDHFLFVLNEVTVPVSLVLSAGDLMPVDVYTKAKDGTTPISATIWFVPFRSAYGYVGETNSVDGHETFYVSNWLYTGVAAICFSEPYHLVELSELITGPTSFTFNPATMPTGKIVVDLDNLQSVGLGHWTGYSYWAYQVTVADGDNMLYSVGTYNISPVLYKYDAENPAWSYHITKESTYNSLIISGGSNYVLQAGGAFSIKTEPDDSSYSSGETVYITNDISDSYGNKIVWVYGYIPDPSPGKTNKSSYLMNKPVHRGFQFNQARLPGESSFLRNIPDLSEYDGKNQVLRVLPNERLAQAGYDFIYPSIRVLDPNGILISQDSSSAVFYYHTFTLSDPAEEGLYNINLTLDTGPFQGLVTGSNSFTVGSASCPEWLVPITVTDGNHVFSLRFGGDPNASDGFDSGCDVTAAPPAFSYYAYFSTRPPINYLSTDIRGWTPPFDADIDWNLRITNADGITSEICWDSDTLPAEGSFRLKGPGLAVDMRTQNCAQTSGNVTLTIEYRSQASLSYNFSVPSGAWYLISLPVIPADRTVQSLFPGATAAFGWDYQNQSYFSATELQPQRAYWLLMLQPDTVEVFGLPLDSYTKNYTTPGWDLAGSVLQPSPIVDTPAGSVIAMFGWNATAQSYVQIASRQAEPQQGYWILVFNAPSSISVGSGSASSFAAPGAYQTPAAFYQKYGALPPPPPMSFAQELVPTLPENYGLLQNYPNPFNPETVIDYQLPEAGQVSLKVYSILGQEVRTLVNGKMPAGYHKVKWDGRNDSGQKLESGVYLYQLRIGALVKVRKTILLK